MAHCQSESRTTKCTALEGQGALELLLLRLCLALITVISVHDATLIVVNHEVMMEFEENPIGLWLLQIQGGDVWVFVAAKLFGTSIVVTILSELFRWRRKLSLTCAIALAAFQSLLLGYLTIG